MRTNAPTLAVWVVAVVIGLAGILAYFIPIPGVSQVSFWLVATGFVVLALATILKRL